MKHIAISIEYAGLALPVIKNEQGVEIVPLKPITDVFGIDWMNQYKKIQDDWRAEFLGVCIGDIAYAGEQKRKLVCIRLDRVAAYLMSLSPAKIRAAGNESGAAFLQAKLVEWADALHDYETFGSAHNPRHADARLALQRTNSLLKAMRQRSATKHPGDKALLDATIRRLAAEAGIEAPEHALQPERDTGDLFAGQ